MLISNDKAINMLDKCIESVKKDKATAKLFNLDVSYTKYNDLIELLELCKNKISLASTLEELSKHICNEALKLYNDKIIDIQWKDAKKEQPKFTDVYDSNIILSSDRVIVRGTQPHHVGIGQYIRERREGSEGHWSIEPVPELYYGQFEVVKWMYIPKDN